MQSSMFGVFVVFPLFYAILQIRQILPATLLSPSYHWVLGMTWHAASAGVEVRVTFICAYVLGGISLWTTIQVNFTLVLNLHLVLFVY